MAEIGRKIFIAAALKQIMRIRLQMFQVNTIRFWNYQSGQQRFV